MGIIPKQNLVGYWPLDGHALDLSLRSSLNNGLIAFYKLDDLVDSVGGFNLTNNGSCAFNPALIGNGVDFGSSANTTKWLNTTASIGLDSSMASTYSIWFYCNREGTNGSTLEGLFSHAHATSNKFGLAIGYDYSSGAHKLRVSRYGATSGAYEYDMGAFSGWGNKWNNLVVTYNGSSAVKFYLNGVLITTITAGGAWTGSPTESLTIGANVTEWGTNQNWSGLVDNVSIYNRELTDLEIIANYNNGSGKEYPILDQSTAGNGVVTGAVPVPAQNPAIPASLAYKLVKASTQAITIPRNLGITGTNLTLSIWAKHASLPGTTPDEATWQGIIGLSSAASSYIQNVIVLRNASGTIKLAFYRSRSGVANDGLEYTFTPKLNTWYHYALTYDGTNVKGYINGVCVGSAAASGSGSAGSGNEVSIGKWGGGANYYFDGILQESAAFNKALTALEIRSIFLAGATSRKNKSWLAVLANAFTSTLSETVTTTDTFLRNIYRTIVETVTNSDTIATLRLQVKNITESITSSDSLIKDAAKLLTQSITTTDIFIRNTFRLFVEAVTATDLAITVQNILGRVLIENVTMTEFYARVYTVYKTLSETVTMVESFVRSSFRSMVESIANSDTFAIMSISFKTFTESISAIQDIAIKLNGVLTNLWRRVSKNVGDWRRGRKDF